MLKREVSKQEIQEAMSIIKKNVTVVLENVIYDCLRDPEHQEDFIEVGLNVSYEVIARAINDVKEEYALNNSKMLS